jgi:hypothetical protein
MSTSHLLPPSFWFRMAVQAPYVEKIVSETGTIALPPSCALPPFGAMENDDVASWSSVAVGWNEQGLGFVVEYTGKPKSFSRLGTDLRDSVDLCVDTRDTRDVHRATRFCHRFGVKLSRPSRKSDVEVDLTQDSIPRASTDAPKADVKQIVRSLALEKQGWRLGLFIPSSCLHGFDPETNRRLGLMVRVMDLHRGVEYLGVSDPSFPMVDDPSLWATLELVRP